MKILEKLNDKLRIDAFDGCANVVDIETLVKFSKIIIPDDYINLVKQMTEIEFSLVDEMYIRLWSPQSCIEMNEAHKIQEYIPNSLAIGDDEGAYILIYASGSKGFGLYRVGFGDLDIADADYISNSLSELLIKGVGFETLLNQ